MTDYLEEINKKMIDEIIAKKDKLVFERILERVVKAGLVEIPFELEKEKKRRFPRIGVFREIGGTEHYYWNDGSEEGLHLISFFNS